MCKLALTFPVVHSYNFLQDYIFYFSFSNLTTTQVIPLRESRSKHLINSQIFARIVMFLRRSPKIEFDSQFQWVSQQKKKQKDTRGSWLELVFIDNSFFTFCLSNFRICNKVGFFMLMRICKKWNVRLNGALLMKSNSSMIENYRW